MELFKNRQIWKTGADDNIRTGFFIFVAKVLPAAGD